MDNVEKELFEQITGRPAFEMAVEKRKGIQKIKDITDPLVEHLMKCIIYEHTTGNNDFEHWRDTEICNYLSLIYNLEVKSGNGKLKEEEYRKCMIDCQGDTTNDYYTTISIFRGKNQRDRQYPDFNPTTEQAKKLYSLYFDLLNVVCPLFTTPIKKESDEKGREYFIPIVRKVFQKNNLV